MILYTLRCDNEHEFETWFKDSAAFDKQARRKLIACPHCGSSAVQKAIMAPRVSKGARSEPAPAPQQQPDKTVAPGAVDPRAQALRNQLLELRRQIEANCDYVGPSFAEEARRIHYGEADPRGIYGESTPQESEALAEEGIAVARVPWIDTGDA